jgi:hypothetical protein
VSWWIWGLIFLFYIGHTFVNWKNNQLGQWWFWFACFVTMIPVFPLVMRFSKNLLWDGLIYELMMLLSYVLTLLLLGSGKGFNVVQYLGLLLILIGFILMKVPK